MAERKQKYERRQVLDSAVADLLSNMEQKQIEAQLPRREREKKARERIKIQSRREQRATYDLPPTLRQRVKEMAEQERLPASQLVTLALLRFLQDYQGGKVDLADYKQSSHSPRYDWNLSLPEELLSVLSQKQRRRSAPKLLKEDS
ncbi:MAG: hypothetical protein ABSE06_19390 [Anaerolineaceae bacterium]|jgi:hypothetical protein